MGTRKNSPNGSRAGALRKRFLGFEWPAVKNTSGFFLRELQ
jgi:hypothetical protein